MSQIESPVFEPLTNQACLNISMVPYTEYNRDSTVEVLITAVNTIISVAVDVKLLYEVPSPWYVDIDFDSIRTTLGLSRSEFTQIRVQLAVIQEGYTAVSLQEIMYIGDPCSELRPSMPHETTTGSPDWRPGNESDLGNVTNSNVREAFVSHTSPDYRTTPVTPASNMDIQETTSISDRTYIRSCRTCLRTPIKETTDQVSYSYDMPSDGYYDSVGDEFDYVVPGHVPQGIPGYDSGVPPGVPFGGTGVSRDYTHVDVPGDDTGVLPAYNGFTLPFIPNDYRDFDLLPQSPPSAPPMNDTSDQITQPSSEDLPAPPQSFFNDELISDLEMDPNTTRDQTTPGMIVQQLENEDIH